MSSIHDYYEQERERESTVKLIKAPIHSSTSRKEKKTIRSYQIHFKFNRSASDFMMKFPMNTQNILFSKIKQWVSDNMDVCQEDGVYTFAVQSNGITFDISFFKFQNTGLVLSIDSPDYVLNQRQE